MSSKDLLVAGVGLVVITVAIVGIVVIEERSGPAERVLVAVQPEATASGSWVTSGATGTMIEDQCVPPVGETECAEASSRLDLRLSGLGNQSDEIHYVAFLAGSEEPRLLGSLEREGEDHRLEVAHDDDHEGYTQVIVTMEDDADADAPGPFVVYVQDAPSGPDRDVSLDGRLQAPSMVTGDVSVNQIGAVTVSATASARVAGLQPHPGFEYRAWLQANGTDADAYTFLDPIEPDGGDPTRGTLDARVERVKVAQQERFLITLEPVAAGRDRPVGFPVSHAFL